MFSDGRIHLGRHVQLVLQNEHCAVYKVQNETGDGLMTCYQLFPGIVIMHCDMHMSQYTSDLRVNAETLAIDHCRKGRMGCQLESGPVFFLDPGTALVHTNENIVPEFTCPTSHYHGLTFMLFLDEAQKSIDGILENLSLHALREKFCTGGVPNVLPGGTLPVPILESLYEVPQSTTQKHRLKLLELLLHLDEICVSKSEGRPYFYKSQVEKIKAVESYMIEDLSMAHTIQSLSTRFDFPLTSMKLCFKGVFGSSIYAYLRGKRMDTAAARLRGSDDRIADIAASVGYENASKFADAFRACMGVSPGEYRKQTASHTAANT